MPQCPGSRHVHAYLERDKDYALERPEIIPRAQAMKAYPLMVKPFIYAPGTTKFLWLHRANSLSGNVSTPVSGPHSRWLEHVMRDARRVPVLVVGAGAGGLATAALLAKRGVRSWWWRSVTRSSSTRRHAI